MTVKITIIGLGQIGASMGLALAPHKESITRVGHDKDILLERAAQQLGAIDQSVHHLPKAVMDARLVVLALPADQVRETLEYIAQDVPDGAIILDVSPIKAGAEKWMKELLPRCAYVGLMPAINPDLLHEFSTGQGAARADLFKGAAFFVGAAYGIPENGVTLAVDFVHLLGAQAVLADIAESDGLATTTHLLPQLVSAALIHATAGQPGWLEARKVASRAYAVVSSGVEYQDTLGALKNSVMQNRAGVLRSLDGMIAALQHLREAVEQDAEDAVGEYLSAAQKKRQQWMNERMTADWDTQPKPEVDGAPSFIKRLFGFGRFKK